MKRLIPALFIAATVLFGSSRAFASMVWDGTFTSGNTSAWSVVQEVNQNRLVVVNDPLGQRGKVLKVTVQKGDNPINASGNRNELAYMGDLPQNEDRYYHWGTLWPNEYNSPDTWQLFTQFHQTKSGGSPPVQFFTKGNQMELQISSKTVWTDELRKGVWHDFVAHINWSADPSKGFIELWYDGKQVMPKTYGATLFKGEPAYLKQGLYRDASVSQTQVLYHQGMVIGTTMDDVWSQSHESNGLTPAEQKQVEEFRKKAGCSSVGFKVAWPALSAVFAFFRVRRRRSKRQRVLISPPSIT